MSGSTPVAAGEPPLVAHVIFALRMGGLENGLVNLINRMPPERYRHAVVCLSDHDEFARRIRRDDVPVFDLHKRPGQDLGLHIRLWRLFRELRPAVVHSRNFVALESCVPAWLAGVPAHVHGEHGRDMHDLDGDNRKHQWLRKRLRPFVDRYIALSADLEQYLHERAAIPRARIERICNGVDTERFSPPAAAREPLPGAEFPADAVVIGTVGRMQQVKDPLNLVRAFVLLLEREPRLRARARLAMIGGGALQGEVERTLAEAGMRELAWLPGPRDDTPALYRGMDVFALPSLAEGISNTILEAMASGLPIVATRVGGNAELVEEGKTAFLVARDDPAALAEAIARYVNVPELRRAHGRAARERAVATFSMQRMVERYLEVYDGVLAARPAGSRQPHAGECR